MLEYTMKFKEFFFHEFIEHTCCRADHFICICAVHQKLMRVACDQHNGSVEQFIIATLNASEVGGMPGKKAVIKNPHFQSGSELG